MTQHPFTTDEAVHRLWDIRYLLRERAMDVRAAYWAVIALEEHPNARVRALATATRSDVADQLFGRQEAM